ncbi:hypothetical protein IPM62_00415 [Candidatus Woesebacteria bacterium]|nr:MAG: hypothetical protein IPM62_00415 [Candidatus Woesebacteria bacterium]
MKYFGKITFAFLLFVGVMQASGSDVYALCGLETVGVCDPDESVSICSNVCGGSDNVLGCAEQFGVTNPGYSHYCVCDNGTCQIEPTLTCPVVEIGNVCYDYGSGQYIDDFVSCGGAGGADICCSLTSECGDPPPLCPINTVCIDTDTPAQCTTLQGTSRPCSSLAGLNGNCCMNTNFPTAIPTPIFTPTPTAPPVVCDSGFSCIGISRGLCFQEGGDYVYCINPQTSATGTCCYPEEAPLPSPTGPPPAGPWPNPYIPCEGDAERDPLAYPEYHSLRPFQASPCRQHGLSAGTGGQLKQYCGNDIIVTETLNVGPGDGTCTRNGNTLDCDFEIDSSVDVNIDLTDAELPIMGNTQLVPNQINGGSPQPEQFAWNRRVNEYFSWWLEGAPYKADEELIDPDEVNIEFPHRHIEAYAGPIRKLYPYPRGYRRFYWLPIPHFVFSFAPNPRSDRVGQSRVGELHDQIFECTLGSNQVPCRWNFTSERYEIIDTRGTDQPGDDIVYPTNAHWVTEPGSPESPYMLMTSTDDMLGSVFTSALQTPQVPNTDPRQQVVIQNFEFVPEIDTDLLYFAHMEENVGLAELLQRTYRSRFIGQDGGTHEPIVYYNTYRCDLDDVRWNTGDDLFGELTTRTSFGGYQDLTPVANPDNTEGVTDPVTGESIRGNINYTASFSCEFQCNGNIINNQCIDLSAVGSCVTQCDLGLNTCATEVAQGIYSDCYGCCLDHNASDLSCERDAVTAASVYTRTPKAEELWRQTVIGDASLVHRMYPKLGVNGMFDELKDFPAVTAARYWSSKTGDPNGTVSEVQVLAGDPSNERPGDEAEIFIPHIGGIYEFAMVSMQDLLRPYVMNTLYLRHGMPPGSGDPVPPTQPGNCAPVENGPCSVTNLLNYFPNQVAAENASQICAQESGGNPTRTNYGCLTGVSPDYSVGLFQINLHPLATFTPRCPGSFVIDYLPSGTHPLNWCEVANQSLLDACVENYIDPERNIREAVRLACGSYNPPSNAICNFSSNWTIAATRCGIP